VEYPFPKLIGRPRANVEDVLFCAAYKVYTAFSTRRFMTDAHDAHALSFMTKVPHFNTIISYMGNPAFYPILLELLARSAVPLRGYETVFAIDSSGFSAPLLMERAPDAEEDAEHDWMKAHIMIGTKTNIVTAVDIHDRDWADTKSFEYLAKEMAKSFHVKEICADKAYFSRKNYALAKRLKATPFIPFKSNATGAGSQLIEQMYHLFQLHRAKFDAHYHQRSNIESTFSAVKRLLGSGVRSKTETAMRNETVLKLICYNLTILIHESHKLQIEIDFGDANQKRERT
jgi:transposase